LLLFLKGVTVNYSMPPIEKIVSSWSTDYKNAPFLKG
jgi:hypothetical protein